MYCGDETGSFIGDVGSHACRFGYGGEDSPKYLAPTYMAEQDEADAADANASHSSLNSNSANNRKSNRCYMPSSCYQGRMASQQVTPILRMSWLGGEDNAEYKKQQALTAVPQVDPNAYLQQGDMIHDWDALERVWQTSFDVLRVRDTQKHTVGGAPYLSTKPTAITSRSATEEKEGENQRQQRRLLASSTIKSDKSVGSGKCVHPILAVTPGLTYTVGSRYTSDSPGSKYFAAVQREQHTRLTELLMESMEAPAIFLAPTPMLSSFCFGRQTALVVDVGAGGCRVTPVVDGLLLQHAQRRNGRGGDWLGNVAWRALLEEKVVLRPRYQVREAVSATATKSPYLYRWAMQDLMYEFRTSGHVQLASWCIDENVPFWSSSSTKRESSIPSSGNDEEGGTDADEDGHKEEDIMDVDEDETSDASAFGSGNVDAVTYELPDGTRIDLSSKVGQDLCRIPELLFTDNTPFLNSSATSHSSIRAPAGVLDEHHTLSNSPLHKLIFSSLTSVGDGDSRRDLTNNIILTGGSSLFPQLEQRLSLEVPRVVPSAYKCRVIASRNSTERSYSAWIGGSVLTSLGSFQQLWLSRTEYEEYGATLSIQRFP